MKHISLTLPWHDRGWDGCVCNNPSKNSYCKGFHSVNAERIRMEKDDSAEDALKGRPIDNTWGDPRLDNAERFVFAATRTFSLRTGTSFFYKKRTKYNYAVIFFKK